MWVLGGFVLLGALFSWYLISPMLTGEADYDGREMFFPFSFLALMAVLASVLPHAFVSEDGTIPTYTDDRYSPALFWYLVGMMALCGLLIALAPAMALFDGYDLSAYVQVPRTRSWESSTAPLWLVAPPYWAGSAVLFFYIVRGVWRRFTRPIPFRSYRGARK
ncbi:hypothetical protein G7068_01215 [Leucobacter viscericola]|uniref:Uncharacterized protein n=1 Tax=Leucobacter viscericola TaxID=2714935 RepID=A0A6G7XC05_9MICO|nr:hypothetical protein [Leucobacter viscericola]QIK61979.1 hypothetical protein G7068_01215 [Leucobacter viscericola]